MVGGSRGSAGWRRFHAGSIVGPVFAVALLSIAQRGNAQVAADVPASETATSGSGTAPGGSETAPGGSETALREPVRIEYRAPAECPVESDFTQRVNERSTRARTAAAGELARSFRVTLEIDASGSVGRVEFVDAEGTPITRSVRGASCDEVASGIALVTALAIDARTEMKAEPAPEPVANGPAQPTPFVPPRVVRDDWPAELPAAPSRAQLTLGGGAGFVGWLGPGGAFGADVFVAGSLSKRGPALRLSGIYAQSSGSEGGREAHFRAWGARVDVCPLTGYSGVVFFQPCGGVDFGSLRAEGVASAALPEPKDASHAFVDLLLIGRLGVLIERWLVLELRGELARPLSTHAFGFDQPRAVVFRPPFLALGVSGGAGVRFP